MPGQNLLPKNLMPGPAHLYLLLLGSPPPPPRLGRFQVQQKFEGGGNLPIF